MKVFGARQIRLAKSLGDKIVKHNPGKNIDSKKNTIRELIEFINNLAYLIHTNGHIILFVINNKKYLLRTELLDSAVSTLKTINFCLQECHIGDAYTLIRKYRDDIFLYLYFIECESEKDLFRLEPTLHERNIEKWFRNELDDLHISQITKYILTNKIIEKLVNKFNLKSNWDKISKDLNNYVHTNGQKYARQNYQYKNKKCDDIKIEIYHILKFITVVAISIMILIKPQFISSTDYLDSLEVGIVPEEGSQYYIAPFVSDFIIKYIKDFDDNMVAFLKKAVFMKI